VWTVANDPNNPSLSPRAYINGTLAGYNGHINQLFYYNGEVYQQSSGVSPCGIWGWVNGAWVEGAPSGFTPATCTPFESSSSSPGGTTGTNTSTTTTTPPSGGGGPTGSALALLNYIANAPGVISGQHSSYWDGPSTANDMDQFTGSLPNVTIGSTGLTPAILGITFGISGSQQDGVTLANAWIASGGIADIMWVPPDPANGGNPANNDPGDFPAIYTPGTGLNGTWNGYVDAIAAKAKAVHGPFIFRLFPEENGGWFWYGAINPTQMIALWRYTHDRLIADGVTNAVWMFNINAGVGNYGAYYPGSSYADIVSEDAYPPTANDPAYTQLIAFGKPFMFGESGASSNADSIAPHTYDNSIILSKAKSGYPLVKAIVIWCQNLGLGMQNGALQFLQGTIDRSQLPAGL
jgi:hypothetical protein